MTYTELVAAIEAYTENPSFSTTDINTFIQQTEQRIYNTVQIANLRKNMTGNLQAGNKYLSCPDDFLSAYSLAVFPNNTPTATGTSGAFTIVVSSASGLAVGQYVTGTGIGTGAAITVINGTTLTLSVANSGTVSGTMTIQGDYTYLLNKDVNFIREVYPASGYRAAPKYYAIFGPNSTNPDRLTFILGPTPDMSYTAELHFYYYPESIVQAVIASFGSITPGSAYTNGVYYNVPLTGGSGTVAYADITVSGGGVVLVTIRNGGCLYKVGDVLSATAANLGGTGSGFSIPVSGLTNITGTSWLGDNFDSALFYGSLVEAYTYMKGEADMMGLYNGKYQEALGLLKNLGDGKQRGDAYRDGQVKLPVR
jgi:hypothetical protein